MTFDIDTAEKACEKGNYKEALKIYEKLSLDENPDAFNGLGKSRSFIHRFMVDLLTPS